MYFLQIQLLENDAFAYLEYLSLFFFSLSILMAIIVQIVEREFYEMKEKRERERCK